MPVADNDDFSDLTSTHRIAAVPSTDCTLPTKLSLIIIKCEPRSDFCKFVVVLFVNRLKSYWPSHNKSRKFYIINDRIFFFFFLLHYFTPPRKDIRNGQKCVRPIETRKALNDLKISSMLRIYKNLSRYDWGL